MLFIGFCAEFWFATAAVFMGKAWGESLFA